MEALKDKGITMKSEKSQGQRDRDLRTYEFCKEVEPFAKAADTGQEQCNFLRCPHFYSDVSQSKIRPI